MELVRYPPLPSLLDLILQDVLMQRFFSIPLCVTPSLPLRGKKVTGTQEPNCPLPNSACFVVLLTSQAAQHSTAAAGEVLLDLTTSINLHWTFSLPNQKDIYFYMECWRIHTYC